METNELLKKFFQNPREKDIIIITDTEIEYRLKYDTNNFLKLNTSKALIVKLEELRDFYDSKENRLLEKLKDASSGEILVRDPFDIYEFVPLDDLPEIEVPLRKIENTLLFCGIIGAKKAKFLEIEETSSTKDINLEGQASLQTNKVNLSEISGNFSSQNIQKIKKRLKTEWEWKGIKKEINEVEKFLKKVGLANDKICKPLFEQYKLNPENIKRKILEINATNEINKIMKIFGSIEIPPIFNIRADYKKYYNQLSDYSAIFEVEF